MYDMMIAGALLQKHSKSSAPRKRHVFLSPDLEYLIWKDPMKSVKSDQMMHIYKINGVLKGAATPQLRRTNLKGESLVKDEDCAFSISGSLPHGTDDSKVNQPLLFSCRAFAPIVILESSNVLTHVCFLFCVA
jgi:hypothetical protein